MKILLLITFSLLTLTSLAQAEEESSSIVPVEERYTFIETYSTDRGPVEAVRIAQVKMKQYSSKGYHVKSFNESSHIRTLKSGKKMKVFYITVLYEKIKIFKKKIKLIE